MNLLKSVALAILTIITLNVLAYVFDSTFIEIAVTFLIGQGAAIVVELHVINKRLNAPAPPTVFYKGDTVLSNGGGFARKGLRGEVLDNDGTDYMNNYVMFENGNPYYMSDSQLTLVKRNEARI